MRNLTEPETINLLKHYNISYPRHGFAQTKEEAIEVSGHLKFPLVLKIVSPEIPHKTDVGGIRIGLSSAEEVTQAYQEIVDKVGEEHPEAEILGVLVAEQASAGPEVIAGITQDVSFGSIVMLGLGGIFTELLHDVSFRVVPIKEADAWDMIRTLRGSSILDSWRGQPPADKKALVDLLVTLSRFAENQPDVEELDLNPIRVYEQGLLVLDAKGVSRI
jgi:acetyl-CoA synthetase (ADP-forming)